MPERMLPTSRRVVSVSPAARFLACGLGLALVFLAAWSRGWAQPLFFFPWDAPRQWYFTGGPHGWGNLTGGSGLDFAPGPSSAILAVAAGQVYYSGWNDWGYGNNLNVRVRHADGWETWYLHLASSAFGGAGTLAQPVAVGQGQYLGEVGSSGSAAIHIHVELVRNGVHQSWHGAVVNNWMAHADCSGYTGPEPCIAGNYNGYLQHGGTGEQKVPLAPAGAGQLVRSDNWRGGAPPTPTPTPNRAPSATLTPTRTLSATLTATPTRTSTPAATSSLTASPTPAASSTPLPPGTCAELVQDGGFELDSAAWSFEGGTRPGRRSSAAARTGQWSALLGIVAPDADTSSWSSARQTVVLPADVQTATLRFWYSPGSEDVSSVDQQQVFVYTGTTWPDRKFAAEVLRADDNAQQWQLKTFDLLSVGRGSLAGQPVHLYFNVRNSSTAAVRAWMYVDDVSVEVCRAPDSSAATPTMAARGSLTPTPTATASDTATLTATPPTEPVETPVSTPTGQGTDAVRQVYLPVVQNRVLYVPDGLVETQNLASLFSGR